MFSCFFSRFTRYLQYFRDGGGGGVGGGGDDDDIGTQTRAVLLGIYSTFVMVDHLI